MATLSSLSYNMKLLSSFTTFLTATLLTAFAASPIYTPIGGFDRRQSYGATDGQVLTWNDTDGIYEPATPPGASGGEANTGASLGSGAPVYSTKVGTELRFLTITNANGTVSVTSDGSEISLSIPNNAISATQLAATIDGTALSNAPSVTVSGPLSAGYAALTTNITSYSTAQAAGLVIKTTNNPVAITDVLGSYVAQVVAAGTDGVIVRIGEAEGGHVTGDEHIEVNSSGVFQDKWTITKGTKSSGSYMDYWYSLVKDALTVSTNLKSRLRPDGYWQVYGNPGSGYTMSDRSVASTNATWGVLSTNTEFRIQSFTDTSLGGDSIKMSITQAGVVSVPVSISTPAITLNGADLATELTNKLEVAELGTDTTGDYAADVQGTTGEVEASGGGNPSAIITVGLPDNVEIDNSLVVKGEARIGGLQLFESNTQVITWGTNSTYYGGYISSNANFSVTFSGAPLQGERHAYRVYNSGSSSITVTIPTSVDANDNSRTTVTAWPGYTTIVWVRTDADYFVGVEGAGPTTSLIVAASDQTTDLTTGTLKQTFRMPAAFKVLAVYADVATAPTGSGITVDINEGGTTILSTKLTIDDGEKDSYDAVTPAVISDDSLAFRSEITVDIDVVGSTTAGKGLKVTLLGYYF